MALTRKTSQSAIDAGQKLKDFAPQVVEDFNTTFTQIELNRTLNAGGTTPDGGYIPGEVRMVDGVIKRYNGASFDNDISVYHASTADTSTGNSASASKLTPGFNLTVNAFGSSGSASITGSANVTLTISGTPSQGFHREIITASGTWNVPIGVTRIELTMYGGGGAAYENIGGNVYHVGQNSPETNQAVSIVSADSTVEIVIGSGGVYQETFDRPGESTTVTYNGTTYTAIGGKSLAGNPHPNIYGRNEYFTNRYGGRKYGCGGDKDTGKNGDSGAVIIEYFKQV